MSWWLWLIIGFGAIVGAIVVGVVTLSAIGFWKAVQADELNNICIRREKK